MMQPFDIIEIVCYIPIILTVGYIFLFAVISLLPNRNYKKQSERRNRFLIIFPAYAEDSVIVNSITTFLKQDYPTKLYDVVVVSDHMTDETNAMLSALPIRTLIATYSNSSKAKALQLTIDEMTEEYDYVVILDADNNVKSDFLTTINQYCSPSTIAIQAHRQAKNTNTSVALLDAVSEEINNTIFRLAHVKARMSSALIGSGMCLEYNWFCKHVHLLSTAGEDKELEQQLLIEGRHIKYLDDTPVFDEKVQSRENFGNQRKRWMAAQISALQSLGKQLPKAIKEGRIDYVDKFIQQLLLPRSLCFMLTPILTILIALLSCSAATKWLLATTLLFISLLIAIPRKFYNRRLVMAIISVPGLVFRMMANILHLKGASKNFIHTKHGISDER